MKTVNVGTLQIPVQAATKTFAILAKRGAGKSYTVAVLAEEFYKNHIPFVVFDPIDVWWGLRFKKDGKGKGLPIVVFGLDHADIPLDRAYVPTGGVEERGELFSRARRDRVGAPEISW